MYSLAYYLAYNVARIILSHCVVAEICHSVIQTYAGFTFFWFIT